jgi:hypothetical protein
MTVTLVEICKKITKDRNSEKKRRKKTRKEKKYITITLRHITIK